MDNRELIIKLKTLIVYSTYSTEMKSLLMECMSLIESQAAELNQLKELLTKLLNGENP